MKLPFSLNAGKKPLLCGFSVFLLLLLVCPAYASVYQLPDTTTDMGMKAYKVDNQYSSEWGGLVLPFIGGFGEKANQTGLLGVPGSSLGTGYTYYTVYDASDFYSYSGDLIGEASFKFKLPYGMNAGGSYIMPVTFSNENETSQFYIKVSCPGTSLMNHYLIEVLDENQNSIVNTSVAQLGSSTPAYVTFGNNAIKITHVNAFAGIISIFTETSYGSASVEAPYSYCTKMSFDISGYPYPVECTFKDYDNYETTKTFDSIPMKIYWLITQIIPDNNQSLYYFFKAVDTIWSTSLSIIIICFSMPFMWLFFAGLCGLTTCVIRGSLKSGLPAGIQTFISVSLIPVKLMSFILEMVARLITAIKPL